MATPTRPDDPTALLIETAARLTDNNAGGAGPKGWLPLFRRNYRHMAVTVGLNNFGHIQRTAADKWTDDESGITSKGE
jgi:hypothetical protein